MLVLAGDSNAGISHRDPVQGECVRMHIKGVLLRGSGISDPDTRAVPGARVAVFTDDARSAREIERRADHDRVLAAAVEGRIEAHDVALAAGKRVRLLEGST